MGRGRPGVSEAGHPTFTTCPCSGAQGTLLCWFQSPRLLVSELSPIPLRRPLDVLQTRAGITVENGNTDAEGRLILCDALADAASEQPDLLVDVATLTGAARTALGAEVPAVFSSCDGRRGVEGRV